MLLVVIAVVVGVVVVVVVVGCGLLIIGNSNTGYCNCKGDLSLVVVRSCCWLLVADCWWLAVVCSLACLLVGWLFYWFVVTAVLAVGHCRCHCWYLCCLLVGCSLVCWLLVVGCWLFAVCWLLVVPVAVDAPVASCCCCCCHCCC